MKELPKPALKLKDFPPKLNKLGQFIINSGQLMTLKDACETTGINYQTVRTQIMGCKKKGLDFHKLVDGFVIEKLRKARPAVYKSLQERAIDGSLGHQKLFAQVCGDLVEKHETKHDIGLTFVHFHDQIPEDILEERRKAKEANVIDVTCNTNKSLIEG
jgi:hypothetical protein